MARPIWKGHISFGLVNVPVVLQAAEKRNELELHLVDRRDKARIRYQRVNEDTGEQVPWEDIVRGYEYGDKNYILLTPEDLKRAAPEASRTIEILSFVERRAIDPIFFDTPYYLEPDKGGEKGYVLLREALGDADRVGIAKVVIRTRQYIAALGSRGDILALDLLRFADEIRPSAELQVPRGSAKSHGVSAQEIKVAKTLVDAMASEWKPEQYHDEFREHLVKWIEQRIAKGGEKATPDEDEQLPREAPASINFMDALKKSLAQSESPRRKPARRTVKRHPRRAAG